MACLMADFLETSISAKMSFYINLRGENHLLEIFGNPYEKSEISYALARNPFEKREISYVK